MPIWWHRKNTPITKSEMGKGSTQARQKSHRENTNSVSASPACGAWSGTFQALIGWVLLLHSMSLEFLGRCPQKWHLQYPEDASARGFSFWFSCSTHSGVPETVSDSGTSFMASVTLLKCSTSFYDLALKPPWLTLWDDPHQVLLSARDGV